MFYATNVQVHLQPFRRNSVLKSALHPEIVNNSLKTSLGGSRSFKVIDVDKIKKTVTSACYDKQHVCTYLQPFPHYTSYGKITFLGGTAHDALVRGEPPHPGTSQKPRDLDAAHGKDFVILTCTVLTQYSSVTDRRMDGQTLRPWLRRAKHSAIARKKVLGNETAINDIESKHAKFREQNNC